MLQELFKFKQKGRHSNNKQRSTSVIKWFEVIFFIQFWIAEKSCQGVCKLSQVGQDWPTENNFFKQSMQQAPNYELLWKG